MTIATKTFTVTQTEPTAPTVTTGIAGSTTPFAATLNGTVAPNGAATMAHFDYGLTAAYGSTTLDQALGEGGVAVAINVTSLTCNTLYHFRATATNAVGTTNGDDATFTTSACPAPIVRRTPLRASAPSGQP